MSLLQNKLFSIYKLFHFGKRKDRRLMLYQQNSYKIKNMDLVNGTTPDNWILHQSKAKYKFSTVTTQKLKGKK